MTENHLCFENTYPWPENGESRPWTEFWVTTLLGPVGKVKQASILYSLDDDTNWTQRNMERSCILGDNEVWHVNLGTLPAGTRIRYAVEGVDFQGRSVWDNNQGKDYFSVIGSAKDLTSKV